MTLKGSIQPNHIPKNKGRLVVPGMPTFVFTSIGDIEEETETVDLPDRTTASGGQSKPVEFTAMLPLHHDAEVAAMETWLEDSKDPVHPLYKKIGTLIQERIGFGLPRTYTVKGIFPSRRKVPGSEMANEGEMQALEITFKADEVIVVT